MTNSKHVPKRRFKDFELDGEWERRKLGDVSTSYSGGTPTVGNHDYYGDEIPFIRSAEINSEFTELSLTKIGLEKSSAKMVNIGDILYALYGATSGEVGISKIKGAINQAVLCIIPQSEYDSNFIVHWLRFQKENIIKTYLQGGQGNLSGSMVKELEIYFPKLSEQIKIGKIFQKLDRLISLQQQKLDKLKNLKKAYLAELFPAEGERVPKRRFPGYEGEWERRKVSELFKITRGYVLASTRIESNKSKTTPYPVYSSQTKDKGLMGFYSKYLYEDAITWTTDGANAGEVNFREGKFYCTNVCGVLLSKEVQADPMIAEAINNISKNYVSYVGNPKLMNNVMAEIEISIPQTSSEREKISHFFSNIDKQISLHQHKLDKLNDLKKAYLNELFV